MTTIRLLDHITSLGLTAGKARAAMKNGKVLLNGIPTSDAGRAVHPADVRYVPHATRLQPGRDLIIVYKDPHLAVLYKPAGMLSVPAGRADGHKNAVGFAGTLLGRALAVHRIDEPTSGLLMVARTSKAQEALKQLFADHTIERRYLAIARGSVAMDEHRLTSLLVRNRGDGLRGSSDDTSDPTSREATTWVRGLQHLPGGTLIEARLETGRTHQVRIHMAEKGHPILGDVLYGDRASQAMAPRLALHAAVLGFVHPFTGEKMYFEAPLADDLEQLRRTMLNRATAKRPEPTEPTEPTEPPPDRPERRARPAKAGKKIKQRHKKSKTKRAKARKGR